MKQLRLHGGGDMKQLRLVWNTGLLDEDGDDGDPILRRGTLAVEDTVTNADASQIATVLDSLTGYTLQEAYLVITEQIY